MRKGIFIFLLLCLSACTTNEVITPPTHQELGKICTLVTTFDEDMLNVSIYYTQNETYPIQNEEDLYEINNMILKYSSSGLKNIKDYPVNQENSLKQCGIDSKTNSIQLATQITPTDYLNFINDLKNYEFYYEVEKNNHTFQVLMPNEVHVVDSMILNNQRVYAFDFDEKELEFLENIQLSKEYSIKINNKDAVINGVMHDHVKKDELPKIDIYNPLIGVGESYNILIQVVEEKALAVDYYPMMTLVKFNKNDIQENTYIQLNENILLSELKEYQLYETNDSIVYDFNDYFYDNGFEINEVYEEVLKQINNEYLGKR